MHGLSIRCINSKKSFIALITGCFFSSVAFSQTDTAEDKVPERTPPPCEYCMFESGSEGFINIGGITVSDDNHTLGRNNGLDDEGQHLLLDGYWQKIFESGHRLELEGNDLGTDNRSASLHYGLQGSYAFALNYYELPHRGHLGGQTVFINERNALVLPSDWVTGGTTQTMPDLETSLSTVELRTKRKNSNFSVNYKALTHWDFNLNYEHEEKTGQKLSAASFLTTTSQLPRPQDFTTDSIDLSAAYTKDKLSVHLAYFLSYFENQREALEWENPFSPINGATEGRMALEPDNQFQQVSAAITYLITPRTLFTLQSALGSGKQDDDFLPATRNALIAASTLARDALDAEVDTQNTQARLSTRIGKGLQLQIDAQQYKRDNKTEESDFQQVVTDNFATVVATNRAYDITRDRLSASTSYRFSKLMRLRAGVSSIDIERNYSEREETKEKLRWMKADIDPLNWLRFDFGLTRSDRDGSTIIYDPEISDGQNPLMRRYHVADRDRTAWRNSVSVDIGNNLLLNLSNEIREDDYPDSAIGLLESTSEFQSLDMSYAAGRSLYFHVFASVDESRSIQSGSERFNFADWQAINTDTTYSGGIGVAYKPRKSKWQWNADVSLSDFSGESEVNQLRFDSQFPDINAESRRFNLELEYALSESLSLNGGLAYEEYDSDDWQIDQLSPSSVSNLLAAGIESPNYDITIVTAAMRWHF